MKETSKDIKRSLLELGLQAKDASVYTTLLKLGRATPAEVAKATGIKRVTVYAVSKNLVSRGLIAEDLGGKTLTLVAMPPTQLGALLKREKDALKKKELLVDRTVSELSRLVSTKEFPIPRIRFVEEKLMKQHLYDRMKAWSEACVATDGVLWGFQDHTLIEYAENWLAWLWKQNHFGAIVKLISNVSVIEKKLSGIHTRRHIKFWNKARDFNATLWVMGDYVVMINSREHQFYLVERQDKMLAHNMREIFKNIWVDIK